MKISANYAVFYGEAFIKESMWSIYDHVDKILIALGTESWVGKDSARSEPIDNVQKAIKDFIQRYDSERKVKVYEGSWVSDTEQRNFLLEKSKEFADYALIIDSDEVWEGHRLKKLIDFVGDNRDCSAFSVGIVQYYRSLYWKHYNDDTYVCYVYKLDGSVRHQWVRHPGAVEIRRAPLDVYYHHLGYAYPSEIVKKKIQCWEHHNEVASDWFENVFMKWTPGGDIQPTAPTGELWVPMVREDPPAELIKHKFTETEIIF